jgi:alkanesulfonate monooxygenase SsuD/methylene tetrahydromethanopterin reductase-like flavin-dependent oxidoreductase (luciferase family)
MPSSVPARGLAIAVELDSDGAHPAAWRAAAHPPAELFSPRRVARLARAAERAGFTAATFEDSPLPPGGASPNTGVAGRLDAVQRAAFVAPLTGSIGLIPVVQAVYSEPFHVATQLASLDHASAGRAGWIVGTDPDPRIAEAYGRPAVDARRAADDVRDALEVARRLWDSWEDDAVIRDVATGRYLDAAKVHYADFEGASFSVKGPSIVPRSPQGRPPVLVPLGAGVTAAADIALVTSSAQATSAAAHEAGARAVWLELEVALDRAGLAAAERIARLDAHEPWTPGPYGRYLGDADGLAELLTELAGQVDGIRLRPAVLDDDLDELGRAVLPRLRERGVHVPPRIGGTLREAIGLEASA